jgi:hypothetical protein
VSSAMNRRFELVPTCTQVERRRGEKKHIRRYHAGQVGTMKRKSPVGLRVKGDRRADVP